MIIDTAMILVDGYIVLIDYMISDQMVPNMVWQIYCSK